MLNLAKAAAALALASLVAGTAAADIAITFAFKNGDAIESTYASLERQTRRACRSESKLLAVKFREQSACRAQALDQIVRQIADTDLIAFHRGRKDAQRQYASLR